MRSSNTFSVPTMHPTGMPNNTMSSGSGGASCGSLYSNASKDEIIREYGKEYSQTRAYHTSSKGAQPERTFCGNQQAAKRGNLRE